MRRNVFYSRYQVPIYLLEIELKIELSVKAVNGFQNLSCAKSCRNVDQNIVFWFLHVCVGHIHTVFVKLVQWKS